MDIIYSIIMREVNKSTGEIMVKVCEKGTKEFINYNFPCLKIRSLFNPEFTFYIALQENEKEAIKEINNRVVKESDLYEKI